MRWLMVFRIEKCAGLARGPARIRVRLPSGGPEFYESRTIHPVHLELVDRVCFNWYHALKNAPGLPAGRPGGLAYHRASPSS